MSIRFRNYTKEAGITEDYHKVREFFVNLGYSEFTYARWDWMTTHGHLEKSAVGKIGIWEDSGHVVGIATFVLLGYICRLVNCNNIYYIYGGTMEQIVDKIAQIQMLDQLLLTLLLLIPIVLIARTVVAGTRYSPILIIVIFGLGMGLALVKGNIGTGRLGYSINYYWYCIDNNIFTDTTKFKL